MTAPPEISVIVMTYNRPKALRNCLASLAMQSHPQGQFEVVVVDGSSTPDTNRLEDFQEALSLQHVLRRNGGVAVGRNTGARAARGKFLAFVDDDCEAAPDWLEKMYAALRLHPGCLVGGGVANGETSNVFALAGQAITEAVDAFYNPDRADPRFFPGLNVGMSRELYWSIGGCDEGFGLLAAEDRDFADRWRAAGNGLVRESDAVVKHLHRGSLLGFCKQYFNYGRGAHRYHSLRRARGAGRLQDDAAIHFHLLRYFGEPISHVATKSRVPVLLLIGLWEMSNLAGYVFQSTFAGRSAPVTLRTD